MRACLLAAGSASLLTTALGCGAADPNMFGSGSTPSAGGSPSAGSASVTGTAGSLSSGGNGGETVGGSSSIAGSEDSGGNGGSGAGCAFSCGEGGRSLGGNGAVGGAAGGNDQAGAGSDLTECSAFSPDAMFLPATQHCYLVDTEPRTFAAAQTHCKELKAHLITLANVAENDFAWSLHGDEHWIGSQDGKMPKQSGVGKYTWVTGEPFDYTNWSQDQPNASKTSCVEGGDCYEHCAFQWKGGDHDNMWNDRYCMHTIASICEWDSTP
ncbi:MAG TPA: C-type lectin domain-containing protein [Polyangiaceae bacterium]|nr:C-type lectin domain-containing protein [Polyangiaceae bacterium]